MRTSALLRAVGIGGLATATAIGVHGGPALLASPLWLAFGAAGALLALSASAACWRLVDARGTADAPLPVLLLAAALLAAQLGAHAGLLAAGAPAHDGSGGTLALHALIALAAAAAVRFLEREAARVLARRGEAPTEAPPRLRRPAAGPRLTGLPVLPLGGRAPPEPA